MFEKESEDYALKTHCVSCWQKDADGEYACTGLEYCNRHKDWQKGAEFGYNKGKEELGERLDDATEIIEQMKDLFFDCWQEKGLKAIKFEQRVNDFLRGSDYV